MTPVTPTATPTTSTRTTSTRTTSTPATTTLFRLAGLCAAVGGLLFLAVQINHPVADLNLVSTQEWTVRQGMKIGMTVLSLVGITGMYLWQVGRMGVLGLAGYLLLGAGYLMIMSIEVIGAVVLPALAATSPRYVSDVLAVATNGTAVGDIGTMAALSMISGVGFLGGGLVFGIALFRANVLARWAAALLALGSLATGAIAVLPEVNQRLFAVPPGIAMIGLGYSLWRLQTARHRRTPAAAWTQESPVGVR